MITKDDFKGFLFITKPLDDQKEKFELKVYVHDSGDSRENDWGWYQRVIRGRDSTTISIEGPVEGVSVMIINGPLEGVLEIIKEFSKRIRFSY